MLGRMRMIGVLAVSPFVAAQAVKVRKHTLRLPEAAGPRTGSVPGDGPPYRIGVVGDSTAAGVGAEQMTDSLAAHLARALARRTGRAVEWQVAARSGATVREVADRLLPSLRAADLAVVMVGVNDLKGLTRTAVFERGLRDVLARVDAGQVMVAAMPPVDRFPSLPQPLRAVMGSRGRVLDRVMAKVAGERHAPAGLPLEAAGMFAADGFHPSGERDTGSGPSNWLRGR
jgi:lysophospholipase L1-like esterase